MKNALKKQDMILMAAILAAAALLAWYVRPVGRGAGMQLQITLDGKLYGVYSLKEDQEITISQEAGDNRLRIHDGEAWMEDADCPDLLCIRQGKIHMDKQTIVCLPHKLVAVVIPLEDDSRNGQEAAPDAVAQ